METEKSHKPGRSTIKEFGQFGLVCWKLRTAVMSVYKDRLGGESSCERRLVGDQLFWVTRAISCLGRGRREEASVLMGFRFHSNLGFSFVCQCICIFTFCLVLFGLVKECYRNCQPIIIMRETNQNSKKKGVTAGLLCVMWLSAKSWVAQLQQQDYLWGLTPKN